MIILPFYPFNLLPSFPFFLLFPFAFSLLPFSCVSIWRVLGKYRGLSVRFKFCSQDAAHALLSEVFGKLLAQGFPFT